MQLTETRQRILHGQFQLVFISPEALFLITEWRRMLAGDLYWKNLVSFIGDEADCVKNGNFFMCVCVCVVR